MWGLGLKDDMPKRDLMPELTLNPQALRFEIGVEVGGCGVIAGIGDVRDGLSL